MDKLYKLDENVAIYLLKNNFSVSCRGEESKSFIFLDYSNFKNIPIYLGSFNYNTELRITTPFSRGNLPELIDFEFQSNVLFPLYELVRKTRGDYDSENFLNIKYVSDVIRQNNQLSLNKNFFGASLFLNNLDKPITSDEITNSSSEFNDLPKENYNDIGLFKRIAGTEFF